MSGNVITLVNPRIGAMVRPNLTIVNRELAKRGFSQLASLNGDNNCAKCSGTCNATSWMLTIPCGHIVCSDCSTTAYTDKYPDGIVNDTALMTCLECGIVGTTFDIVIGSTGTTRSSLPETISGVVRSAMTFLNKRLHRSSSPPTVVPAVPAPAPVVPTPVPVVAVPTPVVARPVSRCQHIKDSVLPLPLPDTDDTVSSINHLTFGINLESRCGVARFTNVTTGNMINPIDVVLLLDVSGSMQSVFADLCVMVKDFISQLSSFDRFTVINFSSDTSQPFPLMPVTDENKAHMISMIAPDSVWGRSTDMRNGANHAFGVISKSVIPGRSMHFVLVTDGHADHNAEGVDEMKTILGLNGIIPKLCTFGGNVDARHLLNVLGDTIENYVALANMGEFTTMVQNISKSREKIQADNITFCGGTTSSKIQQLRTNEEILIPFTFTGDSFDVNSVSVEFLDGDGHPASIKGTHDESFDTNVDAIHAKKKIADDLIKLLNDANGLRDQFVTRHIIDFADYGPQMAVYAKALDDIIAAISGNVSGVGQFSDELMPICNNIKRIIEVARVDPTLSLSARNVMSSNGAYSGLATVSRRT